MHLRIACRGDSLERRRRRRRAAFGLTPHDEEHDGDGQVGREVEELDVDGWGGRSQPAARAVRVMLAIVDVDAAAGAAVHPGDGEGVAFDGFQQAAQNGLFSRCPGGQDRSTH